MRFEDFIKEFLDSEFVKSNIYSHMQIGLPIPIIYKDNLAFKFYFHKMVCTRENITFTNPKFEIILSYPHGRIIHFSELENDKNAKNELIIKKEYISDFCLAFNGSASVCNKLISSYQNNNSLYDIINISKMELLEISSKIKFNDWYGGDYDSDWNI